jgi:hypothetical protein
MPNKDIDQDFKSHFDDFVLMTQDQREAAELRRDYRDLKQWTPQQEAELEERGQAAIVFDQFGKKIDEITGLEFERSTLPKAAPQTPKHEKQADPITLALREVHNQNSFTETAAETFEDKLVEGVGAVIVEYNPKKGDIKINRIPWDRYYYDPYSRSKFFEDKQYDGITIWMDGAVAKARWPKSASQIDQALGEQALEGTGFDDKPDNFVDTERERIRVNQEYFLHQGAWHEIWYSGDIILQDAKLSPYVDCDGEPANPIYSQCDYIDRDNARYGWSERLIDPQKEINHRRSKALFMMSNYTVIGEYGAFGEVTPDEVLDELAKGKSYLEKMKGAEVDIQYQDELGQTQLGFYHDAQASMDNVGINPELAGDAGASASGRAINLLQQGGLRGIIRLMGRHAEWKRRVFEGVWERIKQFWDEEKWIRVTDDPDAMKFVGINIPITAAEKALEQQSGQDIQDIRRQAPEVDELIAQMVASDPRMGEVVETRNNIPEMEMDIKIEEGQVNANVQQEQFDTLAQLAGTAVSPQMLEALLKLSTIPGKEQVLEMFTGGKDQQEAAAQAQQQQQELQNQAVSLELQGKQIENMQAQAEVQNTAADTSLKEAQAKKAIADAMDKIRSASQITLPNQ